MSRPIKPIRVVFQSTRPLRGATMVSAVQLTGYGSFNPRAPCGARPDTGSAGTDCSRFNPRAPCGARRYPPAPYGTGLLGFNPRAPCGARREDRRPLVVSRRVSIHAPLAGRDAGNGDAVSLDQVFQSTRPLRGATLSVGSADSSPCVSIHAPLAGRDAENGEKIRRHAVSIHAPLAGRDLSASPAASSCKKFQSTRPLRGATT